MSKHDYHVIYHNFQVIKAINNIVLAKCNCCSKPRYGVFVSSNSSREFWYHGYSYEEAVRTFNFLISKSQAK